MFQRFHAMKEERDGGFTLIELLVVILIIAILAAIAIPVFLRQREKGWVSQTESALKNAATAQESFLTGDDEGNYASTTDELVDEGYKPTDAVELEVVAGFTEGGEEFCLSAVHDQLDDTYYYDSDVGKPGTEECTNAP